MTNEEMAAKVKELDWGLYRKSNSQEFIRNFVGRYRDVYKEEYTDYTFLDGVIIGITTYSPILGNPHYQIMKAEERDRLKRQSPN